MVVVVWGVGVGGGGEEKTGQKQSPGVSCWEWGDN